MKPLISIVIPTYQRPGLLLRCLQALSRQHFAGRPFEVIVVTDGPDRVTHELLQQYVFNEYNFRLLSLPHKAGPAAARNLGWRAAAGQLILFTDDDCLPGRNWTDSFWNAYCSQNKRVVAFTGQVIVPYKAKPTDYEKNTAQLEKASFVTANCACSRRALEKVNGFDEAFTMAWREDSDLEFKLISHQIHIHFVQCAVVTHPVRQTGWGISLKEQRKSMFNALLFKKYPGLYRSKINSAPLWNYYGMVALIIIAICGAIGNVPYVTLFAFSVWLLLEIIFIKKRLTGTQHTLRHVIEMIITSLLIPFLSVFWTLYGSVKFKTRFL